MKKYFQKFCQFLRLKRQPGYVYPIDEKQFEEDPIKVRTAEISQFQDEARDIETRSPEREVFEKAVFENVMRRKA